MIKKNFFKEKKILITGFNGFVGSWMTSILYHLGSINYGIALNDNKKNEKIFQLKKKCKKIYYLDVRNFKKLKELFHKIKPNFCIHFAAQSLVLESYKESRNTFEINTQGTVNILEVLREFNVPSILITSDKTYKPKKRIYHSEGDELGGIDPYSASKSMADIAINSYLKSFNIKVASCRAGNIIGGGDWQKNRLVPDIIKSIFEKKKLLIRNINHKRPWQHVLDINLNYLKILKLLFINPKKYRGAWNFGPSESYSVKKIIEIFKKKKDFLYYFKKNNYKKENSFLALNNNKLKKVGINNKIKLNEAIDLTFKWYKEYYNNKNTFNMTEFQIKNFLKNEKL
jgi:CDP-glucose 4,6-dehydratase